MHLFWKHNFKTYRLCSFKELFDCMKMLSLEILPVVCLQLRFYWCFIISVLSPLVKIRSAYVGLVRTFSISFNTAMFYIASLWQRPKSPESRCFQCRHGIWSDPQRQNGQAEQKARICKHANTISFWKPVYISPVLSVSEAYLPGTEDTVISKAVPPGRGPSIALRLGWSLRLPQMWVTRVRNLLVWGSAFALTPEQINSRTVRSSFQNTPLHGLSRAPCWQASKSRICCRSVPHGTRPGTACKFEFCVYFLFTICLQNATARFTPSTPTSPDDAGV